MYGRLEMMGKTQDIKMEPYNLQEMEILAHLKILLSLVQ